MLQIELWKRVVIIGLVALGLLYAMPNAFYERVERHNDAVLALEARGPDPELEADAAAWPSWLPSRLVNLGLDLRGGAHLLAEVKVEDVYRQHMDGLWPEVRNALREVREEVGTIRRQPSEPDTLRVRISRPEGMARALEVVRALARPVVTLTGVGANDIEVTGEGDTLIIRLSEAEKQASDDRTIEQSLEIIRRRVDEVGTREPTIQRQGERRILVEVPGLNSAEELIELIGTTAKLTFQPVVSRTTNPDVRPGPREEVLPARNEPGVYYVLEQTPVVTGEELKNAQPSFDRNGLPAVSFQFNPTGARKFGDYTAANVGEPFAIVLDGEVISAPRINEPIPGGSGIISGNFTIEESTNLAVLLRAGALPADMEFLQKQTIGPQLGADSIEAGKIASLVAFLGVLVFMAASYGLFGMIANVALVLNVGLIFGLLSMIGATLTLPGIAGIVLTIGMAVDANVLVFERIKEELKAGRGPARAISLGYEKALSAIVDANITTLITAAILFVMGAGPVRGFAVTLGLGIITSVFTAIYVTRLMVVIWFERRRPRELRIRGIRLVPAETSWDFFRRMALSLGASGIALVASLLVFLLIGLNFGIDFKGGTSIRTESARPIDVATYRAALEPLGLGDVSITEVYDPTFGPDKNVAQIRIEAQEEGDDQVVGLVEEALRANVDPDIAFPSVTSIGPEVSGELVQTAIEAVLAAMAAVLFYIWLRFEWQFALGAVAALVHDVVLTIGIFSVLQIPFDLAIIAALLTIVGYSLNDTVVVFDRVRENLRKYKKLSLKDVLNLSINETLSRTMMTSLTTLIALLALYVLGGDVIRGFVFAMIWGVIVGTYSSVFVASAILLKLGVKRDWSKPSAGAGTQFANVDA